MLNFDAAQQNAERNEFAAAQYEATLRLCPTLLPMRNCSVDRVAFAETINTRFLTVAGDKRTVRSEEQVDPGGWIQGCARVGHPPPIGGQDVTWIGEDVISRIHSCTRRTFLPQKYTPKMGVHLIHRYEITVISVQPVARKPRQKRACVLYLGSTYTRVNAVRVTHLRQQLEGCS